LTIQKKNLLQQADTESVSADSTLIQLDSNIAADPVIGHAKDINTRINQLDSSLGELNHELEAIRASVEDGLDRLGDKDLDLTSKVSDTYKRLGELDNTYKSLIDISSSIDDEITKLTGDISQVASRSSAELEKLEATSEVHNTYHAQQNESLVKRLDRLVSDSHDANKNIQLSVKDVHETMVIAEQKLVAEIDTLANSTQQRDEILAKNIDLANYEIESSKARIIKLQSVDEALDRRAVQLEFTAIKLKDRSKALDTSVELLQTRTNVLSKSVDKLEAHTKNLQTESDKHGSSIAENAKNLFELAGTERKHFRAIAASLLLIVIAGTGLFYYQANENGSVALQMAERTRVVDADIAGLSDVSGQSDAHLNKAIAVVNRQLTDRVESLSSKLADVDRDMQKLDDQAQSLDGRLSLVAPLDDFGGDNIVHGARWLSELPADKFIIRLATVTDRKELIEIAQRYNRYLTQPVAYYTDANGRYVMFYGEFDSGYAANRVLRNMPHRINWQRPEIRSVASVQKLIAL